jgi:hypothetical protein
VVVSITQRLRCFRKHRGSDPDPDAWQRLEDRRIMMLAAYVNRPSSHGLERGREQPLGLSALRMKNLQLRDQVVDAYANAFTHPWRQSDGRGTYDSEHVLDRESSNAVLAQELPNPCGPDGAHLIRRRAKCEEAPQPRLVGCRGQLEYLRPGPD